MSTPEKLRETLADVIAKHDEASGEYVLLHADWTTAATNGEDAKADKLEIEIERTRRLIQRLELRRASLEQNIGSAEEVERAQRGAKLKQTADSILARAVKRLEQMQVISAALQKETDLLCEDFQSWSEARFYAKQSGAETESFANQGNSRLSHELVESLAKTRNRIANRTDEFSRVSVFM